MWQTIDDLSIRAFEADALFASAVQRCDEPDCGQVRQAIAAAIRAFGSRGCAERVAQEFGDHPETDALGSCRGPRGILRFGTEAGPASGCRPPAGHPAPATCRGYIRFTEARRSE